ncbi:hypothetical protein QBC34DRAFT_456103 [Podospora aff. communis PSN243]|uniref:Uncharacterized protein n=1 Tax=Podospora aff. communis PSN243 TaxID=3040156 RepID=A0AAV9G0F2_9PEZI|nr:hypothetical protein QBC34DRAFT_456103 [Podospora aff. communis PSN243]
MWIVKALWRNTSDSSRHNFERRPQRPRDALLGDEKQRPKERLAGTVRRQRNPVTDRMRPRTIQGTNTICHSAVPTRHSSKGKGFVSQVQLNLRSDCDPNIQLAEAYRDKYWRLAAQNAVLAGEKQQLETQLDGQEYTNSRIAAEREQLERQLDDLRTELIISATDERKLLDDSGVRDRWTSLIDDVDQVVAERYQSPPKPEELALGRDLFLHLVADPEKWLQDRELRGWLFQAFIWQKLAEMVFGEHGFSANSYNLSGENRTVYSSYLRALRDECAKPGGITRLQYQKLKAAMNLILSPKTGIDRDRISRLAKSIEAELVPFQGRPTGPDGCFSHTFEGLVGNAVELDVDMAQCRAWYQVCMGDQETKEGRGEEGRRSKVSRLEFSSEIMESAVDNRTKSGTVSLMVTPLLVKWGDRDGNNFAARKILARRQVVCHEDLQIT